MELLQLGGTFDSNLLVLEDGFVPKSAFRDAGQNLPKQRGALRGAGRVDL